jgi:hypothetical protein
MSELLQDLTLTTENVLLPNGTTIIGGSGTRVFSADPPAIGSAFVAPWGQGQYSNIILTSITTVPHYVEGGGWKPRFICNYETNPELLDDDTEDAFNLRPTPPITPESISYTAGVGAVTIDAGGGEWREATSAEPSGDFKDSPIFVGKAIARVAEGSFTIPKIVSESQARAFIQGIIPKLGKINSSAYKGFNKGQVLFTSVDGSSRLNRQGNVEYLFRAVYQWRVINGINTANNVITEDDWNYVYGQRGWIKPVQTVFDPSTGSAEAINFIHSRGDISI